MERTIGSIDSWGKPRTGHSEIRMQQKSYRLLWDIEADLPPHRFTFVLDRVRRISWGWPCPYTLACLHSFTNPTLIQYQRRWHSTQSCRLCIIGIVVFSFSFHQIPPSPCIYDLAWLGIIIAYLFNLSSTSGKSTSGFIRSEGDEINHTDTRGWVRVLCMPSCQARSSKTECSTNGVYTSIATRSRTWRRDHLFAHLPSRPPLSPCSATDGDTCSCSWHGEKTTLASHRLLLLLNVPRLCAWLSGARVLIRRPVAKASPS